MRFKVAHMFMMEMHSERSSFDVRKRCVFAKTVATPGLCCQLKRTTLYQSIPIPYYTASMEGKYIPLYPLAANVMKDLI